MSSVDTRSHVRASELTEGVLSVATFLPSITHPEFCGAMMGR